VTVSTYRVVPEASASGTAPCAEPDQHPLWLLARSPYAQDQALARAASPDYTRWLAHVRPAAGCTHPVRLAGHMFTVARSDDTARVLSHVDTADLPDGVIYKPCGSRLTSVCPSCAATYQRDAFQLVRAGLLGGKGVPDTVAKHPAVFDTFTAPSFGPVHTRVVKKHFCTERRRCVCQPEPCHPDRTAPTCRHGRHRPADQRRRTRMACYRRHAATDRRLGSPICPDCYDYPGQVVWNLYSAELWRRTRIGIERRLRRLATQHGIDPATVKLAYGKAAEMQRRATVHFHAVIRLDGADPADREAILPPPAGIGAQDLADIVEQAARATRFSTEPHPARPQGWTIQWGTQLDQRVIAITGKGQITREQVAGYIAKYATKSTEATGHVSRRLTDQTIGDYADPAGDHAARLIHTCWRLGQPAASVLGRRPAGRPVGYPWTCRVCATHTMLPTCPGCGCIAPWNASEQPVPPTEDGATPSPFERLRRCAHRFGYGGHFFTKSRRYSTTFGVLRASRVTYRRNPAPTAGPDDDSQPSTQDTVLVINFLEFVGAGWHTTGDALLANTSAALAREHQYAAQVEIAAMAA